MKRVPTDREILERIYARYEPKYKEVSSGQDVEGSDSRIYLPVDLAAVATELNVDGNIVFGRLYYYLDRKYAYQTQADGSGKAGAWVHLFWLRFDAPQGKHWVNSPCSPRFWPRSRRNTAACGGRGPSRSDHSRFRL